MALRASCETEHVKRETTSLNPLPPPSDTLRDNHFGVAEFLSSARLKEEQNAYAGCSKWLSSKTAASEEASRTLRYVEPLSDARTPLADIFSILLTFHVSQPFPPDPSADSTPSQAPGMPPPPPVHQHLAEPRWERPTDRDPGTMDRGP